MRTTEMAAALADTENLDTETAEYLARRADRLTATQRATLRAHLLDTAAAYYADAAKSRAEGWDDDAADAFGMAVRYETAAGRLA